MSKKKGGQSGEDLQEEEIVQAVVIADSFNKSFAPLTTDQPRALLPLVNLPLLDYTLEFLVSSGIQEIIVYCCVHADLIRQHLKNSKWMNGLSGCEVKVISSEDCLSVGDALRDIDAKSIIKSDFVLVNGDIVSNVKLGDIINKHKERKKTDKSSIMTMVMRTADPGHPARCHEEEVMLAIRPDNLQIAQYQKGSEAKKFSFPLELFQENSKIQIRYDLLDCHISICSPNVPPLYTENFDFETREYFIKGILDNEEILGHTIHVHILEDGYAARVSNMQMYDAVSKDVLSRWTYPIVPDFNVMDSPSSKYSYGRHNIYKHKSVTLARGSILKENVIVGEGTLVGKGAFISNSVIGKNCKIGENVYIEGAYLLDNVVIEDTCVVKTAVLGQNVHILSGVKVLHGSVLASNVRVGPFLTLHERCVLVAEKPCEDAVVHKELVGAQGEAYKFEPEEEDDDVSQTLANLSWGVPSELGVDEDDEDSNSEGDSDEEGSLRDSPPPDDSKLFYFEVLGTMKRAFDDNIASDNIVLEINSLKAAYFMEIKEVTMLVTQAVLMYPLKENSELESTAYVKSYGKTMKKFLPLLKNYVKSTDSQNQCLTAIEDTCLMNTVVSSSAVKVLHHLYNCDILSEEVLLKWHGNVPDGVDQLQEREHIRTQVAPFINWLEEAEEESSEEESD